LPTFDLFGEIAARGSGATYSSMFRVLSGNCIHLTHHAFRGVIRSRDADAPGSILLNPPQRPAELSQCDDLLFLLFAQDITHADEPKFAGVNVPNVVV
jgi:hypothetical protein